MAAPRTRPRFETFDEVLKNLGGIDPARIRVHPAPGKATEKDHLRYHEKHDRLYELVDGTLVEKPMGAEESNLALHVSRILFRYLDTNDLGTLYGESTCARLWPNLLRAPDLCFVRWDQLPVHRKIPREPRLNVIPPLVIEVLSPSNTAAEMLRKRKEYFLAGVLLVWEIDPRHWTVTVYTAPDVAVTLTGEQTLDGGSVLPGFSVPLSKVFEQCLPPEVKTPRRARKRK